MLLDYNYLNVVVLVNGTKYNMLENVNNIVYLIVAIVGVGVTFIGFVRWLNTIYNDVKINRKLREEDKAEILEEIKRLEHRINTVEKTAQQHNEKTTEMFMRIREDIAELKAQIALFINKK